MLNSKSLSLLLQQIGKFLTELRIQKGFNTLKEFVEVYDLPLIQYWRIENGKANLTMKTLVRLLSIHKIALDDFFPMVEMAGPGRKKRSLS